MISTLDLSRLPAPPELERLMQSLAMLDTILSPEWELRYYSFNADWGGGDRMGSSRNGSGDELFALFMDAGCFIKGFDHEAALEDVDASQFYRQVPDAFSAGVTEPAFSPDNVTSCYWREPADTEWRRALVPNYAGPRDGSEELLAELDGDPASYLRFAESYFETSPDPAAVAAIYAHSPLTPELANAIGPIEDWDALIADAEEIGYPVA